MFAYLYANVHALTQPLKAKISKDNLSLRSCLNYVYFRQRIQIQRCMWRLHKLIIERFFAWVM